MIKHGHQFKKDFDTYINIVKEYPSDFNIVASGNHDEFGIDVYNSPKHYIIHYICFCKKKKFTTSMKTSSFQEWNTTTLTSLCWTCITIQRWKLDLAITWTYTAGWSTELSLFYRRKVTANARILITHFTLSYTTERVRSKSKKTLMWVMTINNMTVLLAGHTHRELIVHRNTTLEINTWAIKRGSVFHRLIGL